MVNKARYGTDLTRQIDENYKEIEQTLEAAQRFLALRSKETKVAYLRRLETLKSALQKVKFRLDIDFKQRLGQLDE